MQGYIVNINRVKDEDLIVSILTENSLITLYRFYGARHANVHLGNKIDFEVQSSAKSTISMLREVLPLSQKWMLESQRLFIWQQFIKLLFTHLKDVIELDIFYFHLLQESALKMHKQHPKRVMIEAYLSLLAHEGRLHDDFVCFICDQNILEKVVLARSYLPAHEACVMGPLLPQKDIQKLFDTQSTLHLSDIMITHLWELLQEGF
jgi:hypothetical protein